MANIAVIVMASLLAEHNKNTMELTTAGYTDYNIIQPVHNSGNSSSYANIHESYTNASLMQYNDSQIDLIEFYCILPMTLLGIIGNLASIAVFRCTKLRRVSASYYLTVLSLSDTGFLLNLFAVWLEMVDVPAFNQPFLCQFLTYLASVCCFLSPWLIVTFTVERFVATCYPLRRASICTVARAKAIVAILVVIALLSYSYLPVMLVLNPRYMYENSTEVAGYMCDLNSAYRNTMHILNILDTVFTLIVPVILIIGLNIQIARAIWRFELVRRHMTMTSMKGDDGNTSSTDTTTAVSAAILLNPANGKSLNVHKPRNCCSRYQVKITKMLLIISSVFIGLNAPSYVVRLIVFFIPPDEAQKYSTVQQWCQLGYYLNFAINFLLYCVSGQNFRKSLKTLFCRVTRRAKQHQLSRTNTGTITANCNNSTITNNTTAVCLMSACQPCPTSIKGTCKLDELRNGSESV